MIITTSDQIPGKTIVRTIGWVKGNTIRARHLGRDIMAGLRGVVGGEITEYTKMMAESREQSVQRMIEDAEKQGANAVVGLRFTTSMVMQNASEILAYGTAVVVE
ncbi:MAG: YbjQ family protein [Dehalococcoidales bacterium]|nr:MAG: YbjQ family protein [Dehalococcoidales bacterium]